MLRYLKNFYEEKMFATNYLVVLILHILPYSDGACTIPEAFKGSTWRDSARGEVTFTTWKLQDWSFVVDGQTVDEWEVVDDTKFNVDDATDGGYIAYRALDTFDDSTNVTWYSYLCLKYEKLTEYSYKYHQYHGTAEKAGWERVKLHADDSLSAFEEICDENFTPNARQFHVMVKKDKETEARLHCPDAILGRFDYTLDMKNGSVLCGTSRDNWDGCADTKLITFNYTSCSAIMLYSAGGKVQCVGSTVATVVDKQYTYVVVQNLDTFNLIDNVVTFQFACISATSDGNEMSVVPGSCTSTQVPYEFPEDAGGVDISNGAKIANDIIASCPRKVEEDGDESDLNIPLIVGLSVGGGVLLIVIVVLIICCCCCKRRRG